MLDVKKINVLKVNTHITFESKPGELSVANSGS